MAVNHSKHVEPHTHIRLDTAQKHLQNRIARHGRTEAIALERSDGRVLAETVVASRNVPHYQRAAMDGYAVRASDTTTASEDSPNILTRTESDVQEGTAVYVDTGCELSPGADSVARVEKVKETSGEVHILEPIREGKDVAPIGEDVTAGQELYRPGKHLQPSDLGVLKSVGIDEVTVFERPTVSVIPTGEELVENDPGPGEVIETNGLMVSRYVTRWGGIPTYHDVVTDDRDALKTTIRRTLSEDIVVTIGGSSVGKRDLLPDIVAELGELYVHHVAIKPGHPVALGEIENTPIIMLPGYPVASILNAVQFVRPALYRLQGTSPSPFPTLEAELGESIQSHLGTRRFERVYLETRSKKRVAKPVEKSGSGALTSVTLADGWVTITEEQKTVRAGETVTIETWEPV